MTSPRSAAPVPFSDSALAVVGLGTFLVGLAMAVAGAVAIYKSDIRTLRRHISDAETMLRLVLLPCICFSAVVDSVELLSILSASASAFAAIVVAATAEALWGVVFLRSFN